MLKNMFLIFLEIDATRSDDVSIDLNGREVKPCVKFLAFLLEKI